jgi:2',3'-cyclic-nucleotide 2'-phosphodiesterase/3'-nucleotidase
VPEHPSAPLDVLHAAGASLPRLRILATSDLHAHITAWDYGRNRANPAVGLARTASLIATARTEVACCLLVDNGDFLQGGPMGDLGAVGGDPATVHPMISAMNALGYDAGNLGNHEFSFGMEFLLAQLAQARFPFVAANLVRRLGPTPVEDDPLVPPTLMVTRALADAEGQVHPLRIGIIGLAPPQTTQWDGARLQGRLQSRDMLEAAAAHVPRLRAAGADVVLALSHSGLGVPQASAFMENASAVLATLPGIDALVAGHTHQVFPQAGGQAQGPIDPVRGLLAGKPAVMPGFYGSHLGVIDLDLAWNGDRWQIAGGRSALRPIARRLASGKLRAMTVSAPQVVAVARPAHEATRRWAERPVGRNPQTMHSYFSMVTACDTVRLVARAQADFVAKALLDTPHAGLPVLSAAAPFHAGGRGGPENYTLIATGRLLTRHAFDLYPHPNAIAALLVTGADLQHWLERSFSQFNHVPAGAQDAPLLNPDFPSFNFDTIEGLTWQVDLTVPPRFDNRGNLIGPGSPRIRDLRHAGMPLAPDQRFVLATNSYRATGAGGFAAARTGQVILNGQASCHGILLDYVTRRGEIGGAGPPNWRFSPLAGTSVVFDSAPAAADHLNDLLPLDAEPLSLTPHGFRRFRLHL